MSTLQEAGLKVSLNKCSFFQKEVSYLGYKINQCGLHTTDDKVSAIKNAPIPENLVQLQSFLGLVNYYGKFVPNLSTVLYPMYRLLKSGVEWVWSEECKMAFRKINELLTSAPILVHFNPDFPVVLSCDASDYGIGAVLTHLMPDKSEKPIAFASRTLSEAEKKYSQIEKEGLGIIFGLCKFNQYIYGREFTLQTDHKPHNCDFSPRKGNTPVFSK